MKKTALLAAAAALFVATPAFAQSAGSIGLNYTNVEDEGDAYQLDGAFGGASGAIGYQIDAGLGQLDNDFDSQTIAGHLYWNGGGWRLGGVIAHTHIEFGDSLSETVYGIEGTWDLGPQTVLLGSYTIGEAEAEGDFDTSSFDIGMNYYFVDNFRVGGAYGFGNLDVGAVDVDTSNWRLNAEWQPWTTPVSFTLGYNSFDIDGSNGGTDSWTIGARWNFGASTLRERDNATPFDARTGYIQRLLDLR
ncbi:MAG: hypothetical protein DCF16_18370 [Alphaproteobacteria bacterium]|nr:MAG: hypothetical protein DCF16_18370 [Alphaproteobacteria bacterium]